MLISDNLEHYGKKVICQFIPDDFRKVLLSKGVDYMELPINNTDLCILKYETDGKTKYAVLEMLLTCEEYHQMVYLTESIPDDCNWDLLVRDITAQQERNEPPMKMRSRLKMIFDEKFSMHYGDSLFKVYIKLLDYGYTKDNLMYAAYNDVDKNYIQELLDEIS
jgi:hypothetical protein